MFQGNGNRNQGRRDAEKNKSFLDFATTIVFASRRKSVFGLLFLALILTGCGRQNAPRSNSAFLDQQDLSLAIIELRQMESRQPDDAGIKRDLGVAYFKSGQWQKAVPKLEEAMSLAGADPRTLLFLGLSYEKGGEHARAVDAYSKCLRLHVREAFQRELHARIAELQLAAFSQEIRAKLDRPDDGGAAKPNSLAVLHFRNLSQWHELDPVIQGLAELMTHDLSKVEVLAVVPQRKLDVLLEMKNFDNAQLYDESKITDTGRLLGTRQVISGGIERLGESGVNLSAAVVDARTGKLNGDGVSAGGRLSDLLRLEKKIIFNLLADMQVTLKPAEKQALSEYPTENMLAFIAFGKGVRLQSRRRWRESKQQFELALEYDPGFELARQRLALAPDRRLSVTEMEQLAWR